MMKNVTKTLLLSDKLPTFFHSFLTRISYKNIYTYKKQGQKTHTLYMLIQNFSTIQIGKEST